VNSSGELGAALHLARAIAETGPLSVASFMEIALAHPRHGYYRTRPGIGADGDFITAPEISQLFGEMIGVWVLQSWLDLGSPKAWHLIELGPGRGTLAADLLHTLKIRPQALDGLGLHLVEISEPLRRAQAGSLASLGVSPHWHARLPDIGEAPCIIIANEFFDALPIRQFLRLNGVWCERRVALAEPTDEHPRFAFVAVPTLYDVISEIPEAADSPDGYVVEICPSASAIAAEIGSRLTRQPGRALIIDYGDARPPGEPTLQAVRGHARHDVLAEPGTADLTAHVDFAALAHAAAEAGARAHGPVPQGAFLEALGLQARAEALRRAATPAQSETIAAAVHRLTDAAEMGALFKVLALGHPDLGALPGFPNRVD